MILIRVDDIEIKVVYLYIFLVDILSKMEIASLLWVTWRCTELRTIQLWMSNLSDLALKQKQNLIHCIYLFHAVNLCCWFCAYCNHALAVSHSSVTEAAKSRLVYQKDMDNRSLSRIGGYSELWNRFWNVEISPSVTWSCKHLTFLAWSQNIDASCQVTYFMLRWRDKD